MHKSAILGEREAAHAPNTIVENYRIADKERDFRIDAIDASAAEREPIFLEIQKYAAVLQLPTTTLRRPIYIYTALQERPPVVIRSIRYE